MTKNRMFSFVTCTWNPVTGCEHLCSYCWSKKLVEQKLRLSERYAEGFIPKIHEEELRKRFKKDEFIFVSDMGDLFGSWVPNRWIESVIRTLTYSPRAKFLLLTKNPIKFLDFNYPDNCILGATIESNKDYATISKAPLQTERLKAMIELRKKTRLPLFISVEPVMEFDNEEFLRSLKLIEPWAVAVGYDNYHNELQEPILEKTKAFMKDLSKFTMVVEKTLRESNWESTSKRNR